MIEKQKINTAELNSKKKYEIADIDNLEKYKFEKGYKKITCANRVDGREP